MKILDVPKEVLALLAQAEGASTSEWGTPEELSHRLLPVERFDPALLPATLRPWVEDIAKRMQCPIDYVAVAAMVYMGSIIGTACSIRPKQRDNWMEVPNLWGAVVGPPGRMKSPALSAAMVPLKTLANEADAAHQVALKAHDELEETRKVQYRLKNKALDKKKGPATEDELREVAALRDGAIEAPKLRRYMSNDATVEKLGEIIKDNPRGLLVFRDELMGLLDGFERAGREGERQFYLEAWNGTAPYHVDRISRGHISIPRLAASLFGGIQPDKIEAYIGAMQTTGNDGFIQRFQMMVYPDELQTIEIVDQEPDDVAKDAVTRVARALAHADYREYGGQAEAVDAIPFFRFDEARAQTVFKAWLLGLDRRIRDEEAPIMQEHLGKYRKLVPALALVTHLIDIASDAVAKRTPVSESSLQRAIGWARYLESHARRIYALGKNARIKSAQALAKKIQTGQLSDGFSERDVYKKEWSTLTDPSRVREACGELEVANWIRQLPPGPRVQGRRPTPKYEVNPAVKGRPNARAEPTKPPEPQK